MSGNSGTGSFRNERYVGSGGRYAQELDAMREVLDTVEVAGFPRKEAELVELERLVAKYPEQADLYLSRLRSL